jgi:alpha-1,3-glucosyltransferase
MSVRFDWLDWLVPKERVGQQLVVVFAMHFVLRLLVGLSPHSGEGAAPQFGDFEAQRHWMEITGSVPVHDWYRGLTPGNDLSYWGLDYPPLTAFVSFAHGRAIAAALNDSRPFALVQSRGFESPQLKLGMRLSVLLSEVAFLWPAVLAFVVSVGVRRERVAGTVSVILLQPALIQIDHAHFQYNGICLALTLLAIVAVVNDRPYWATVWYCSALNFKHMSLYFAPAFFFQMLGDACRLGSVGAAVLRVALLGAVAAATFAVLWAPWLAERDPAALAQIAARLLPWERGLFEDKVANFWCTLSPVLKLKGVYAIGTLRQLCLGATLLAIAPASLALLTRRFRVETFLCGLLALSMAFFLFSYQVHEKSLLMPLLPLSLLFALDARWHTPLALLSLVGHFSMYPLAQKDRTRIAYFALAALFYVGVGGLQRHWLVLLSLAGMLAIHLLLALVTPPAHLPDLFTVACTSFSFLHFAALLVAATVQTWRRAKDKDD